MNNCIRLTVFFVLLLTSASSVFAGEQQGGGGVVTGLILDDSTGLPIKEAFVGFFKPHGLWVQRVHTDTSGIYSADLDTGRYLVRFERFGYIPEWFDDAHELRDAFIVDVHADTTITANAGLQPMPRPEPVTVTGTVRDSLTGNPLPNSLVVFLRPHRWLRQIEHLIERFGGFDNERFHIPGFGRLHGVVWFGLTDTAGNYEAHLLKGFRYIAFAFKPGYVHEFYKDKITPFNADRISFNGDSSGIDFDLVPNPNAVNMLAGKVMDPEGAGVESHVLLIRITPFGWLPVRYQATDSTGRYKFMHLVDGRFLVRAIPVGRYGPAWHKADACGIRDWHNADVINLTSSRDSIDVCVKPLNEDGFCHIDGHITGGGGRNIFSAAANEGVPVYAVSTTTGEVVGYDVTEEDGSYSIDNISPGSYTIVVDQEGYTPSNSPTVTVDETNGFSSSGNDVGISGDPPLDVIDNRGEMPQAFTLGQNYPNPFNPTTEIRFDVVVASQVTIKIYNVMGQEIAKLADQQMQPGNYNVKWDGRDIHGNAVSSGVYYYRMQAGNFSEIKKMILMK